MLLLCRHIITVNPGIFFSLIKNFREKITAFFVSNVAMQFNHLDWLCAPMLPTHCMFYVRVLHGFWLSRRQHFTLADHHRVPHYVRSCVPLHRAFDRNNRKASSDFIFSSTFGSSFKAFIHSGADVRSALIG